STYRLSSLLLRPPPMSSLFPYTTLFRSLGVQREVQVLEAVNEPLVAAQRLHEGVGPALEGVRGGQRRGEPADAGPFQRLVADLRDRKSTRLNSSHLGISYAVFCLKKKKE